MSALSLTHSEPSKPAQLAQIRALPNGDALTISFTIRQDPMSVTLDGPAIFTLATALIISLHFFQPSVAVAFIGLAPVLLYIHNDYHNYLKLGPGGTPATIEGYIRVNWFRLWALRDPFEPPQPDPTSEPSMGILSKKPLAYRSGPRPTVAGIAPQRQVDQQGSKDCYLVLRHILENHGSKHTEDIAIGTSCFEKNGLGLFGRLPLNNTCQGEICHVHSSDYSMHMSLHPDDVKEVLLKGWGQRHPLARQGWLRMPVPRNFVMVYAPRSTKEVRIVCRIIEAAQWWVMAKEHEIDTVVGGM